MQNLCSTSTEAKYKADYSLTEYHLISGGCGFIGRHVALALARCGQRVLLADRNPPAFGIPRDLADLIAWVPMTLNTADWNTLVESAAVVHHYAWTSIPASANSNPLGDLNTNVVATIALLEALRRRGSGRVVFASSGGTVYGKLRQIPVCEDHPLRPINAYGAGKATAELYLGLYRELYGIDCRIARIANPFGVGQNIDRGQGAATKFMQCALVNKPIVIWGDGEVVRDYLHVTDVARALVALAAENSLGSEYIFNIGSGQGTSLNQLVHELDLLLQRSLIVKRETGRTFDVPINVLDTTRIRQKLRWSPSLSFSEGLRVTLSELAAMSWKAAMPSTQSDKRYGNSARRAAGS